MNLNEIRSSKWLLGLVVVFLIVLLNRFAKMDLAKNALATGAIVFGGILLHSPQKNNDFDDIINNRQFNQNGIRAAPIFGGYDNYGGGHHNPMQPLSPDILFN